MPNLPEVLAEISKEQKKNEGTNGQRGSPEDTVRRRYIARLQEHTGRNVICYYSGWLVKPQLRGNVPVTSVMDADKNGFMSAVHGLNRGLGLDLVLHTPGGEIAAAESLVDYLRKMFGTDMRAIVPQLAMSAGTMIACACRSIVMGKQSNLGPIDPQINGIPASGVLQEFDQAIKDIKKDRVAQAVWQPIIGKYHPTFLGSCQRAITWADQITSEWLETGMFKGDPQATEKAGVITAELSNTETTLNHARHIHVEQLQEIGLHIECLEDDPELQDLVLTLHHAYMHTFSATAAVKIIENHRGVASIMAMREAPTGR